MDNRAGYIMKRFGTLEEQNRNIAHQRHQRSELISEMREQDETHGFPQERVLGAGVPEGHAKTPA